MKKEDLKEILFEAIGEIEEKYVAEAREPEKKRTYTGILKWGTLAACLCICIYAAGRMRFLTEKNDIPMAGGPETAGIADEIAKENTEEDLDTGKTENSLTRGDYCPAIMIDGVIYYASDREMDREIDLNSDLVRYTESYAEDGVPKEDGETNFLREPGAPYVILEQGLAGVYVDGAWKLFESYLDMPADLDGDYKEAEPYPEDLEKLQEDISNAMVNQELPFVTSSAIMENPLRLEVSVTTEEEALLEKLRAYDPEERYLVIVYGEMEIREE